MTEVVVSDKVVEEINQVINSKVALVANHVADELSVFDGMLSKLLEDARV